MWKVWKTFFHFGQSVKITFRRKRNFRGKPCRKNKFIKVRIKAKIPLFHRKCGKSGVVHERICKLVDNFVWKVFTFSFFSAWKTLQPLKHRVLLVDKSRIFVFRKVYFIRFFLWIKKNSLLKYVKTHAFSIKKREFFHKHSFDVKNAQSFPQAFVCINAKIYA